MEMIISGLVTSRASVGSSILMANTPSGERNLGIPSFGGGGGHQSRLEPGQICAAVSGTWGGVPRRLFRRYQPSMASTVLSVPSPGMQLQLPGHSEVPNQGPQTATVQEPGKAREAGGNRRVYILREQATVVEHSCWPNVSANPARIPSMVSCDPLSTSVSDAATLDFHLPRGLVNQLDINGRSKPDLDRAYTGR